MKLYFEEQGSGQAIVLIHGFPFNHTIFEKTVRELSASARVILPDLRGFGRSQAAGAEVTLGNMAADIRELLDDLNIKKAVLGGHSMGGYLSMEFCHEWPERVAGVALIASHAAGDTEEQRQARLKNIEKIRAGGVRQYLLEGMLPKLTKYPELAKALEGMMLATPDATLIGALGSMAGRANLNAWLTKSGIPAAAILGEEDMIMPVPRAVEMAEEIGADPIVKVPAAGHMLMMENPDMLSAALKKFLERVNRV
jgi:3-oxoadipate enol-lactonase